jgi:hypothetical protein
MVVTAWRVQTVVQDTVLQTTLARTHAQLLRDQDHSMMDATVPPLQTAYQVTVLPATCVPLPVAPVVPSSMDVSAPRTVNVCQPTAMATPAPHLVQPPKPMVHMRMVVTVPTMLSVDPSTVLPLQTSVSHPVSTVSQLPTLTTVTALKMMSVSLVSATPMLVSLVALLTLTLVTTSMGVSVLTPLSVSQATVVHPMCVLLHVKTRVRHMESIKTSVSVHSMKSVLPTSVWSKCVSHHVLMTTTHTLTAVSVLLIMSALQDSVILMAPMATATPTVLTQVPQTTSSTMVVLVLPILSAHQVTVQLTAPSMMTRSSSVTAHLLASRHMLMAPSPMGVSVRVVWSVLQATVTLVS